MTHVEYRDDECRYAWTFREYRTLPTHLFVPSYHDVPMADATAIAQRQIMSTLRTRHDVAVEISTDQIDVYSITPRRTRHIATYMFGCD